MINQNILNPKLMPTMPTMSLLISFFCLRLQLLILFLKFLRKFLSLFFFSLLYTLISSNLSSQAQSFYPFIILVSLFGCLWILAKVLMFLSGKCKIIHDTLGHLMEAILNKMIYFLFRHVKLYILNFSKCMCAF